MKVEIFGVFLCQLIHPYYKDSYIVIIIIVYVVVFTQG